MANRLEVPVQTAIKLEMVPPLQRDGQHERLILQVVLLLLVLLAAGLVPDLLVDVLGHLALRRVYAQLAVIKGKCPVTVVGVIFCSEIRVIGLKDQKRLTTPGWSNWPCLCRITSLQLLF